MSEYVYLDQYLEIVEAGEAARSLELTGLHVQLSNPPERRSV
jgi:hypothetical protein